MKTPYLVLVPLVALWTGCAHQDSAGVASVRAHLQGAQVTLTEAIELAAAEEGAGVIIEAELTRHDGALCYAVTHHDETTRAAFVELSSGAIVDRAERSTLARAAEAAALVRGASITPAQAIAIAEREVGGQAIEFEAEDGQLEVEVLAGGKDVIFEVALSTDGRVLEVEREDEHDVVEDDEDDDAGDD